VVKVSGMDLRHTPCTWRSCRRCFPEDMEVDESAPHMVAVAGPIALSFGIVSKQKTQTKAAFVKQVGERRQLQEHSLVMLQDGEKILAVGRVVSRELTVETDMDNDMMAHVSVAFHDPTVVLAAASEEREPFRLVGFTGAFFAFEPVLSCLQRIDSLPFRDEILLTAAVRKRAQQPALPHRNSPPCRVKPTRLTVYSRPRARFAGWHGSRVAATRVRGSRPGASNAAPQPPAQRESPARRGAAGGVRGVVHPTRGASGGSARHRKVLPRQSDRSGHPWGEFGRWPATPAHALVGLRHSAPSFGKVAETHVLSSLFATLNRAH